MYRQLLDKEAKHQLKTGETVSVIYGYKLYPSATSTKAQATGGGRFSFIVQEEASLVVFATGAATAFMAVLF